MRKMWSPSFTILPLCFCFLIGFCWNWRPTVSPHSLQSPASPDLHARVPRETINRHFESTMWRNVKGLATVWGYWLSTKNIDKAFPNPAYWRGHAPTSTNSLLNLRVVLIKAKLLVLPLQETKSLLLVGFGLSVNWKKINCIWSLYLTFSC